MIEKILSEIEELIMCNEEGANACYQSAIARESAYYECKEIVQEVAKEYGWIPKEEKPVEKKITIEELLREASGIEEVASIIGARFGIVTDELKELMARIEAPYQKGE